MRGLYGTQDRYLLDVMRTGLYRSSAAFFCLPDVIQEEERLRLTLMCAVYHALGLSVLRSAIQEHRKISEVLAAQGVKQLTFLLLEGLSDNSLEENLYLLAGRATYPYVKASASGSVAADRSAVLELSSDIFDRPIHIKTASLQLRFFQKKGGKAQYLENCDMVVLRTLCERASSALLERYRTILWGNAT